MGNEDLGERCVHGTEFAVNNIVRSYDSKSRFAIHDDPGAGSRSTIRDPKIVTSLTMASVSVTLCAILTDVLI